MVLVAWIERHRRTLLFLFWATALLLLIKFERYSTFVRPEFRFILTGTYVVLLFLLASEMGRKGHAPFRASALLSPAILLVPILFLANAQGAKLDSYAFEKRSLGTPRLFGGDASLIPSTSPPDQASDDLFTSSVTLLDLYRSPQRFQGKKISLIGMTYRNEAIKKDLGDNGLMVFRFAVSCCAADAQPIAVMVEKKSGPSDLPNNSWVKVEGRYTLRSVKDGKMPVIEEAVLSNASEPNPPYLY